MPRKTSNDRYGQKGRMPPVRKRKRPHVHHYRCPTCGETLSPGPPPTYCPRNRA